MIVRATLDAFARLAGLRPDQAEEELRSPAHARAVEQRISRRQLFFGAGAVAAGSAFSFTPRLSPHELLMECAREVVREYLDRRLGFPVVQAYGVDGVEYDSGMKTLNVRCWVRPLGLILEPIETKLGVG